LSLLQPGAYCAQILVPGRAGLQCVLNLPIDPVVTTVRDKRIELDRRVLRGPGETAIIDPDVKKALSQIELPQAVARIRNPIEVRDGDQIQIRFKGQYLDLASNARVTECPNAPVVRNMPE
jgi:hypothetical protein